MDDLDHSMHIAEFDWTSFYDESEECGLLRPSLARPDSSRLSDSEESENSESVLSSGLRAIQQSPDVNSDRAESNAAAGESCAKLSTMLHETEEPVTQVDQEMCLELHVQAAEDVTEETRENITNTLQTGTRHVQCSSVKTEDGGFQTEADISGHEPDHMFPDRAELDVTGPHAAAVSEDESGVAPQAERERWFVTLDCSPARRRVGAAAGKKKRRQNNPCKKRHMCGHRQEKSLGNGMELEIDEDKSEPAGKRVVGGFTISNQNLVQNSGGHQSAEINDESISDLLLTSCDVENVSEKLVISHSTKENITEATMDGNKHVAGSSASTSHDKLTPKEPSQAESADSDESEDGVEFFSIHSYDSEGYLSATESVEDTQDFRPADLTLLQRSVSLKDADSTRETQMHARPSALSCNVAAANCDSYECNDGVEPELMFPSAGQTANKMPDDDSACDIPTHSTELHMLSDTTGPQEEKINLSASGSSSGDQLSPLPVPDLTVTPCPAANSPETYAEVAGHTRPVFAISAFWDEMEKLTINDILQLRMGRSTPPGETQETVTAHADECSTSHDFLADTAQYNSCDGGLMELSDTADSDYFTQPDESKPDRSSCEFSTSDFEEEYWQFIGTSRNPSPDPHSKSQDRTSDSLLLSHEGRETTSSEGKETSVPLEEFARQCFEDPESHSLSQIARRMTKSKSMHNVQALNKDSLTVLFGHEENGLFLSRCQSLEEIMVWKVSDSQGTLIPTPFLSGFDADVPGEHFHTCFPEVFECVITEDKARNDSWGVTVYNPEDISVAPVFDYTLCALMDDVSLSSLRYSLCGEEKPIPIFSCCSPTIREITFPKPDYVFLSADCKREEVDSLSPIRVVSRSFIQCGTSAPGSHGWKSAPSMRKISFHDKGSIWCGRSGAWVFPVGAEKMEGNDPTITVLSERKVSLTPSQMFRDHVVQQSILESSHTSRREGIFSTLRQSDMCLVCIAFASWVLRSSDPEAADAWKAALLANVSALSAIQYLRQYVKNKRPLQDHP
ncbi:Hypothetical protein SMAX5B_002196 [Scophthalmus maximus]|uniref:PGC-1 and ERR-induced regulator in muscle protein 1 n=1 Tax=Scophthalmus maximus TaxID=52904 RepID=A0A2U9BGR6_SCOMX|nr:Hypothetical protein SMAX5B_002196 [Scophthalmus maximus]